MMSLSAINCPHFEHLICTKRASGGTLARVREIVQALRWCILLAACTLASWVDALGRRDRGESGFYRCRDPERHRDGPLQLSPSLAAVPRSGKRRAMEQFKTGDTVVRRGSVSARRGSVVRVADG